MLPHTEYDGEDLTREIDEILREFRPTLLAVTLPQDQHPDHCATYFFARRALEQLEKKEPTLHPIILAFLIHFGQWPVEDGANSRSPLLPPAGFPGTKATWSLLPLTSSETDAKRLALLQYQSQMLVMGSYLMSFVRSNEIFLLDPPTPGNLQSQQLCGGQ
jgi:LmbE family N-acetylglucosaminyl deacetylase